MIKHFYAISAILILFLSGCAQQTIEKDNSTVMERSAEMIKGKFVQKEGNKLVLVNPFNVINGNMNMVGSNINDNRINKRKIFDGGTDLNAESFRIPSNILLNNGDLLAFTQVQYDGASDYNNQDVGLARSNDFGKTWYDKQVLAAASSADSRMLNPTFIYDEKENKIIMIVTEIFSTSETLWWTNEDADWDIYTFTSTDYGQTWTKQSIKASVMSSRQADWNVVMGGLGTGVKMGDGTYVFAAEVGYYDGADARILNTLLYSDDLINWELSEPTPERGDEANIVLLDDGSILMNARNYGTYEPKMRKVFVTSNLGIIWTEHATHQTIPENRATMGHTFRIRINGKSYILFSHMQSENSTRKDLGVSVLNNAGTAWNKVELIEPDEYEGYSFLAWNERYYNRLFLAYEKDGNLLSTDISYLLPKIKEAAEL